jgi:Xaa-Pro aminopeptidase
LGIEAQTMTLAERDDLAGRLEGTDLVPTTGLVEELRRSKDDDEVRLLNEAIALGDEAFTWVLDRLVPGKTERQIALDLEIKMREMGADEVSFPPIVGSGPLSAHIHHTPSERELQKGDLVLLDFGCRRNGYCSDLTRTVVLGSATDQQREIYRVVLEAQRQGIEAVAPGSRGQAVDAQARGIIERAGYGDRFGHGLGHGVGLDIHEEPRLRRISEDTLQPGDVVTVEPGVYLDGVGGVRIEDIVLVTESGREVLGSAPKQELIEL